jgi:hypothetical protein
MFRIRSFYGDRDRIQTCNLLIRSQMLYSVKLRSHCLFASANIAPFSVITQISTVFFLFFLPRISLIPSVQ